MTAFNNGVENNMNMSTSDCNRPTTTMHKRGFAFLLILCMVCAPLPAWAQVEGGAANCEELTDPDVKFQMELCSAHLGCRLVMGIHSACAKVKKFVNNLKNIGERDSKKETHEQGNSMFGSFKSLLGGKPEITSNQVFEASLSDEARALEARDKDWRERAGVVKAGVAKAGTSAISEKLEGGGSFVYVGDISDGKPNGWGTWFDSTGAVVRGEFKNGRVHGQADNAYSDGIRRIGQFSEHKQNGDGLLLYRTGDVYKGKFQGDLPSGSGARYRPDGSLMSRGTYEKNELVNGEIFDTTGTVVRKVDKVMDAMLAAEAQQKTQAERMAREAEVRRVEEERQSAMRAAADQQRKSEAAAAERAYRESLNSMSAGQLFAKADELSSAGDKSKAREVLRTLVSRFPDHPLAATAAQQISAFSSNSGAAGSGGSATPNGAVPNVAVQTGGGGSCWDVLGRKEKEYEAVNRRPVPQGATPPLMRVMWMTADSIKVIDSHCAGDAKAAKYRGELQNSFNQAKKACEQLSAGGCVPNPYDGSGIQDNQAETRLAAERQKAAAAERERLEEKKKLQDLQDLTNALTNLGNTLQRRKQGGGGGNSSCPMGQNLIGDRCYTGAAQ